MDRLDGRVAVVVGATNAIGRALAQRLASEGMSVVVADEDERAVDDLRDAIRAAGGLCEGVVVDVRDGRQVQALAEFVFASHGSVHVLCNNATFMTPDRFRPVWMFSPEEWSSSIDVNLLGIVHALSAFIPRMLETGTPAHVVNVVSIGGLTSGAWSAPYGVAKHGAVRAAEALYAGLQAVGSAVGTSLLLTGTVRTEANPGAAQGPDDIAQLAVGAILGDDFYVFTSDAFDAAIAQRAEGILGRRNPEFPDIRDLKKTEARR